MSFDTSSDDSSDRPWADAPLFHLFWKNGELNPGRAAAMGQRIARDAVRAAGTPSPVHRAAVVALPEVRTASVQERDASVWERRVSSRTFGNAPMTLQDLGHVLYPLRTRSENNTRLLPSGGAKYPIQTYVALCRVDAPGALRRQIAWYDNARHGLVPVRDCPAWPDMASVLGVDWIDEPAAVVFMIARPDSMLAKYGERGGRFLLIEAGVHLGALSHQVAQIDLAGCAIGSYHDEAVLSLLGLSAPRHVAMLAYAFGAKQCD